MEFVRELTEVDELRVIADPRRWAIHSLLIQGELTVKELAERIGEPQKRLYHHIRELERVGLIRVTRTELRYGIVQKHYRATSQWLDVSPALMHLPASSDEVRAAIDWYLNLLRMTAGNLRQALGVEPRVIGSPLFWASYNGVRMSPQRARDLAQRIADLHTEFVDNNLPPADGEPAERIALTLVMTPLPPRVPAGDEAAPQDAAIDEADQRDRSPPDPR
jgi:DNA-binding transcriptional ArsR family regulator